MKVDQKKGRTKVSIAMNANVYLVKSDKLRFKAVLGLSSVFEIEIPVQNTQRHNALVAVRWQVKRNLEVLLEDFSTH